jgi:hypothetical protein
MKSRDYFLLVIVFLSMLAIALTGCTTTQKRFWFGDPDAPYPELPEIKPHSPMGLY